LGLERAAGAQVPDGEDRDQTTKTVARAQGGQGPGPVARRPECGVHTTQPPPQSRVLDVELRGVTGLFV